MNRLPSVTETAKRLGLRIGRTGSAWHVSPCPACHAVKRHPSRRNDRRGAIGVRTDDSGFRCFVCDVSGTAHTLARLADNDNASRDVPEPPPPEPPRYPPQHELAALWDGCVPTPFDDEVTAWLGAMRIDSAECARALGAGDLPRWATAREPWRTSGHRMVFPLFDARGVMRNVLARAVRPAEVKSLGASGYARKGLVLACPLGVAALRGQWRGRVVVVEGERKTCISAHLSGGRWATIGTGSGMWSNETARQLARAGDVSVYSDPDAAGARYAQVVYSSLAGMVELRPEFVVSHGAVALREGVHVADDDAWADGVVPGYVR